MEVAVDRKLVGRNTEQRQLLLEVIQQADRHLDANEIYQQARQMLSSISLSTVYRSLQLFKRAGLVEEHQLGGMRRCYEAMPQAKHHHLVCLGCGRVLEFRCSSAEKLKSKISKAEGFKITDAKVRLTGYCPECQRLFSNGIDTKLEQQGNARDAPN